MTAGRRGLFWPLILIAVGVVFLLANFNVIPSLSVVALLNLWPLLLILIGLDIAFARRWPVAVLVADVAVIALGLALVAAQPAVPGWVWFGADVATQTDVTVPRDGVRTLDLRLTGGAGRYRVSGGASALVEAHSERADLRLRRDERSGDRAEVRIDQGSERFGPRFGEGASVETRIGSDVATSLDFNAGAGEFTLDLRDVQLAEGEIDVGAASVHLVLPKPRGEVSIRINAGASSVVVEIPDGIEARVTTNGALISVRSENPRATAASGAVETSGYASATDRVTIRVTAGASSVTVR